MKCVKLIRALIAAVFCVLFCPIVVYTAHQPSLPIASKTIRKPIKIVTTLEAYKVIVEKLIGDNAEVEALIPSGLDPCKFDPLPSDRQKLKECDLWIGSKQSFEAKVAKTVPEKSYICVHERSPHELLSPETLKKSVILIADELKILMPSKCASIDRNRDLYLNEVDLTCARVKEILATSSRPKLISLHPTFSYFCDAFDIEYSSIENCHGGACLKTIENVKAQLKAHRASLKSKNLIEEIELLVEPSVDPEKAKRIAETLETQVRVLDSYNSSVLCTYLKLAEAAAK